MSSCNINVRSRSATSGGGRRCGKPSIATKWLMRCGIASIVCTSIAPPLLWPMAGNGAREMLSNTASRCRGSGGSSIGCVVTHRCSRTYSDGRRVRCGTSSARRAPCLSIRHISEGSHPKPPSMSTTRSVGNRSKTPSTTRLTTCDWNASAIAVWSSM